MRIIMRRHARRATATIIKHMTHALNWDLRARTGPSTVVGKNHYIYIYGMCWEAKFAPSYHPSSALVRRLEKAEEE